MQKGSVQPTSSELEIKSQIFEKFRTWLRFKSKISLVGNITPGGAGQHNKLAQRLYFTEGSQFKISSLVVLENTTCNASQVEWRCMKTQQAMPH